MANKGLIIGVGVLVLIIIGAAVLLNRVPSNVSTTVLQTSTAPSTTAPSAAPRSFSAPIMITDPAQVPAGTSALVFTYSNVQVNSTGPSGSQWINANGSGSVNLIAVLNRSQVMAYANVTENSTLSQVRLLVNSVKITVNGTSYSVPVSNPQLTLTLSGNTTASVGSGILIDYTPTVSPAWNANATVFVRVPSGKAVVTGNINSSTSTNVGFAFPITATAKASLAAVTPNLTITNATLMASGNRTVVSVTVKNNGNQSVTMSNLVLYGTQNVSATAALSVAAGANLTSVINQGIVNGVAPGVLVNLNIPALLAVGLSIKSYAMQNFAAGSGGSLTLVTSLASAQTNGTTISGGSSATFTYNGIALYNSNMFQTTPKEDAQYRMVMGSKSGASASTVVTAT